MSGQGIMDITDEEYSPEVVEQLEQYKAWLEEEGPGRRAVTADQLPRELKVELGLDAFPEDMQNDILALAQKVIEFTLTLLEECEQEAPPGRAISPAPSKMASLAACLKATPWREIGRDAWKGGATAAKYGKFLPGYLGKAARPLMGPAGFIATGLGAAAGWATGCGLHARPSMPRR